MNRWLKTTTLAFLFCGVSAQAEIFETEWIHSEEGFQEESLGLTLKSIEEMEEHHKIIIEIPEHIYPDIEGVEEVVVSGQVPEKPEAEVKTPKKKVRAEFVRDYENDYYGLIIYMDKKQKWPVRLYFDAEQ